MRDWWSWVYFHTETDLNYWPRLKGQASLNGYQDVKVARVILTTSLIELVCRNTGPKDMKRSPILFSLYVVVFE